MIEGFVIE